MPRYEIFVEVRDEYAVEVEASTLEEAEEFAIESCEFAGNHFNGTREITLSYLKEGEEE